MARNKSTTEVTEVEVTEVPSDVENVAATEEAAAPAEPEVVYAEVLLMRDYVPVNGDYHVSADDPYAGTDQESRIYHKVPAGTVVSLPLEEAQRAIDLNIATVTAALLKPAKK